METKENIDSGQIERELKLLWQAQSQVNKMKACLFNLIIYTQNPEREKYFKDYVQMIMEEFPCRVIFIQGNRSAQQPYLRLHVSTEGGNEPQSMACDQILIEASGDENLSRVPFLILPHFIPDLPVYLLWGEDPTTEHVILPHLQQFATRLIFDSETVENLARFSQTMLVRLEEAKTEVLDMNWARIGGWREVLAQTFDSPKRIEQLALTRFIKIVYNDLHRADFHHPETQAIYLQGWLAAQLKWKFEKIERKEGQILFQYTFQGHSIKVTIESTTQANFDTEEILEFEVSDQENYFCTLSRQGDNQVVVHSSTQYECELPFTVFLQTIQSGRSFMQEVFYQKTSDHYIHLLKLIGQMEDKNGIK